MNRTRPHSALALATLVLLGVAMSSTMPANASADDLPPEVVEMLKQQRIAREQTRNENPRLFAAVSDAMLLRDPIGINFGTNTDEYDPESQDRPPARNTTSPSIYSFRTRSEVCGSRQKKSSLRKHWA
jgi:hypothetical protein